MEDRRITGRVIRPNTELLDEPGMEFILKKSKCESDLTGSGTSDEDAHCKTAY